jgi:hypothetical protein
MEEFRFENTVTLTEEQYIAVWAVIPLQRRSHIFKLAAFIVFGLVLLLTPYTFLFGLIFLGLVVAVLLVPKRIIPWVTRRTFQQLKYLRDPLTYGVSEQKLWVKGSRVDVVVSWSMLVTWRETEDWFVLSPSGIPPVYLSLARLRAEGLYGRVRALAASNAPEYGTTSPRW